MLEHRRYLVLHTQEGAAQVDVDQPRPVFLGGVDERRRWLLDTGVVEGDVQSTEITDGPLNQVLDLTGGRHVARDGEDPPTVHGEYVRGLLVACCVDVGQDHVGALGCEARCRGAADAAPCTVHDGAFSGKPTFSHLPSHTSCLWGGAVGARRSTTGSAGTEGGTPEM